MSQNKYRPQEIRAPRGNTLTAKSWLTEAPLRMLMNNLDPDVAENPHELVVYGGDWARGPQLGMLRRDGRSPEKPRKR